MILHCLARLGEAVTFSKGEVVEARWSTTDKWYLAKIICRNENGTYHVRGIDENKPTRKQPAANIRRRDLKVGDRVTLCGLADATFNGREGILAEDDNSGRWVVKLDGDAVREYCIRPKNLRKSSTEAASKLREDRHAREEEREKAAAQTARETVRRLEEIALREAERILARAQAAAQARMRAEREEHEADTREEGEEEESSDSDSSSSSREESRVDETRHQRELEADLARRAEEREADTPEEAEKEDASEMMDRSTDTDEVKWEMKDILIKIVAPVVAVLVLFSLMYYLCKRMDYENNGMRPSFLRQDARESEQFRDSHYSEDDEEDLERGHDHPEDPEPKALSRQSPIPQVPKPRTGVR